MESRIVVAAVLLASVSAGTALAQQPPKDVTVESLQASAKALAGLDWMGTFMRLCIPTLPAEERNLPTLNPADYPDPDVVQNEANPRPLENYYAMPQQIGQNLYWLGSRQHNSWALVASSGEIIIIDGNYAELTEVEIFEGLRKLGLDPADVRYEIYAHAHGDHDGGSYYTEQTYPHITLVYGEGDWPSVEARTTPHPTRNGPDNVGTDGRVISVGDVSVQLVATPGHTPGTLSFLFEYRDLSGEPRRVAYSGGTAISFTNQDPAYYDLYIDSVRKFQQAAADFGADVLMSNHSEFDNAYMKANTVANRGETSEYDPFVVGQRDVMDYLGVVELCSQAAKLRSTGSL
ncbi:MAG: MBL fold metallo-hydrolase [Bauldia sp.]|nr:MBL fold metallo-hydrolase [Bauldia sp.]